MANVLLLNGAPHAHGAIDLALTEVAQPLQECGLTTEIVHIGQQDIRGCIACGRCGVLHRGEQSYGDSCRTENEFSFHG